ncbi:peptidase S8 and S53 subtilisin kexin sedolisin [Catenulispora acidiphila DSM 44928]|uniref:Peptidase S8 and S53 subtilisin kexin sedolisin n=1 Tax=Catenulispora acidiphila (strain DSM 44928 / JCM 14897 / NBRC 102108 / NRRL B-24433 / ID139908) TaxID=479433 RepID=C7Q2H4_CATAD|nr:S8 family serine peptidase [Catenulispora acidiphila]ACU69816.1 peptidase S8 and S53 subtilisin kexin sedolisin [Catenulispora acidiphila DSM 44928]
MQFARKHRIAVVAVTALGLGIGTSAAALAAPAPARPSAAQQLAALSTGAKHPVIVLLKNQHPELSVKTAKAQRKAATTADQTPLVNSAQATGAQDIKKFSVINGFSAKMTDAEAANLRQNPGVEAVVTDQQHVVNTLTDAQKLAIADSAGGTAAGAKPAATGADGQTPADKVIPGTCPTDPSKPLLEPEALQTTNTAFTNKSQPQAQNIVDGKGVKVAWIADGLDVNNPDFIRADGSHVFSDYQDFSGTDPNGDESGDEAFGDASSIAAQGLHSYDLSKYVMPGHPLPAGCNITVRGVAPGASLVGLNVFGAANLVFDSTVVQAVDYAVNVDNVDVINESLGSNAQPTEGLDITSLADDAAVAAGVTVVTSTGDGGVTNTEGQPAVDPNVIGVGATTTFRDQAQTGTGGARNLASSWASNNTAALSSSGTNDRDRVPDLVAPGQGGWALCSPEARFSACVDYNGNPASVEDFGGTSMASPLVAGGAALVIEAYENTHGGARPAPALVKQILTSSASDLGLPADQQGSGELNTYRAVRMAMSVKDGNGSPAAQGDGLMATTGTGDTQISLIGTGGSKQSASVTLTNTSPTIQTVSANVRELDTTVADIKGTKAVDFTDPNSPWFYEGYTLGTPGLQRHWFSTTFTVPAGADHLTGMATCACTGTSTLLRLVLVGPNGEYENWNSPQGTTNYATVDQANPPAGKWTAYFYANANATGFKGNISYDFLATKYKDVGSVSPASAVLKPGQSQKFTVKQTLARNPGDVSAALAFSTPFHQVTTMPVTKRTLISTNNDGGSFTGTLTGGNGRASTPSQTESYYFDVPRGKKNLAMDLTFAGSHAVSAFLESPDHQVVSLSTNIAVDAQGNENLLPSLTGYVDAPAAGRWVLFMDDINPGVLSGDLADTYNGQLRYNAVDASAMGLPSGKLAAGKAVTAKVTIKNTGAAPLTVFADPRLNSSADYDLPAQQPLGATVALPFATTGAQPSFQIPTHTTELRASQSSTIPADFSTSGPSGMPEVYGVSKGLTAGATVDSPWLTPGIWGQDPTPLGPTNAAVTGSATEAESVTTLAFDRTAAASTGDLWLTGVDPSAPALVPVTIMPGQTGTLTVTFTPTGASGSKVSGVVYVDTYNAAFGTADELTGLPYSYTVK